MGRSFLYFLALYNVVHEENIWKSVMFELQSSHFLAHFVLYRIYFLKVQTTHASICNICLGSLS
jgi:hypothetical protein